MKNNRKREKRGFTLVELMVSVSIMVLILSVIFISNSRYSERLNLKVKTYDVFLALRQAQVYSLAVKGFTKSGNPTKFDTSYGVYFDATSPSQYISFTDEDADSYYQSGTDTGSTYTLSNGITIKSICGTGRITGFTWCSDSGPGQVLVYRMAVTFRRPDSQATVEFKNISNNGTNSLIETPAYIYLESPSGYSTSIKIDSTGQMSIQ